MGFNISKLNLHISELTLPYHMKKTRQNYRLARDGHVMDIILHGLGMKDFDKCKKIGPQPFS